MKNKEEPSANSSRGNPWVQVDLYFPDDQSTETTGSLSRPGLTAEARAEKPALREDTESLMEQIVDDAIIERAWRNVKRNRGAPGPDGETIGEFFEQFRSRWPSIRQQLLDGSYEPSPVRRKVADKPDGGERLLGIPNVQDRLIQAAIVLILTPIFDPHFSESSFGFRPKRSAQSPRQSLREREQPSKSAKRSAEGIATFATLIFRSFSVEFNTMS